MNSITGRKPWSRRRIRSSVQPTTCTVLADGHPRREALDRPVGVDGEVQADLGIVGLAQRAEREAHLRQRLVRHPAAADRPQLVGDDRLGVRPTS